MKERDLKPLLADNLPPAVSDSPGLILEANKELPSLLNAHIDTQLSLFISMAAAKADRYRHLKKIQ